MSADADKYIWDARVAVEQVLRFTSGKSIDDYLADELLRAGVERWLTILGEALNRLRQLEPDLAHRVTGIAKAVALRNLLVHAYADIDDMVVWGVVQGHLPAMLVELQAL